MDITCDPDRSDPDRGWPQRAKPAAPAPAGPGGLSVKRRHVRRSEEGTGNLYRYGEIR